MSNKELTPLEALERIRNLYLADSLYSRKIKDSPNYIKELDIIETALKEGEKYKEYWNRTGYQVLEDDKKLKALEIIKEKGICLFLLEHSKNVDDYNDSIDNFRGCDSYLKQDEFDLLKEVLK